LKRLNDMPWMRNWKGEIVEIPSIFVPPKRSKHPYWKYRDDKDRLKTLLSKFLNKEQLSEAEVKEIADYFLNYSLHVMSMAYASMDEEFRSIYAKENKELARKIREMTSRARSRLDLEAIIGLLLEYGIDPI